MKVTQKQVNISRFNHLLAFGGLNWVVDRRAAKPPCSRLPRNLGIVKYYQTVAALCCRTHCFCTKRRCNDQQDPIEVKMFVSKCKLFLVRGSKKEVLMDRTRFTSFSSSTSASNPVTSAPFLVVELANDPTTAANMVAT